MKKIFKSLILFAAAATVFSACNKEVDIQETAEIGGMQKIQFSAFVNDVETKATLTTADEATFTAAWENGDKMAVEALSVDAKYEESGTATWNGSFFDTDLPANETVGEWTYDGFYPAKTNIPFGSARFQNGSNYASAYDIMKGDVTYQKALLGKDPDGGNMVIPMTRLTSIIYFHLTSSLDEALASATLTVEGGNIAAETVSINNGAVVAGADGTNTITITFTDGTAPSARDFCLWYNILPVTATRLTLTVTTISGKTATLTNTKGKTYAAGKLNKIVKGVTFEEGETPVAGDTYAWILASGDLGSTGSPAASVTKGTPELTWTADYSWGTDTKYFGYESARGLQIGKGGDQCSSAVFTTSEYTGYIESIRINFSHASSGGSSASIKVGNTALVCDGETSVGGTTSAADYVFTASELVKGNVEITLSNSAAKAMYLKSIEINPDTREKQTLSFPQSAYSVELTEGTFAAPTLTGAMTTVSYTSSDETVATVNNSTGEVSLIKAGSTTISATAVANEEYQEGSASYTLTVTAGPSPITDVIAADDDESVYTQGVVAQVNAKGFIMTDGTDNLLVYQNATPSVVVGQSVKVSGTRDTYNNIPQIASPVITKGATGQDIIRTVLTTVTSTNATGFTSSEYVSLTGTLTISVNGKSTYYNVSIDGSTTKGSLYQVVSSATYSAGSLADLDGQNIKVTGYVAGSTDSYLNIAPVDIERMPYLSYTEPETAGFAEDSQTIIPVDANVSWTAAKGTDTDNIIKSVTYDSEKVTVTFNANDGNEKTATVVITPDSESGLSVVEVTVTQSKYSDEPVKEPQVLFHQSFGSNTGSATAWSSTYSVMTGVSSVYVNAEESVVDAKVSKNTMGYGSSSSALISTSGKTGQYIIGPLNATDCEEMVVTNYYGMSSSSWQSSSFMKCSYSINGTDFIELTNSSSSTPSKAVSNNTNYADAQYNLPSEAASSTLYLKFEFYCYNLNKNGAEIGQAYLDEVELYGRK